MKRTIVFILLSALALTFSREIIPEPVEVKPVLVKTAEPWIIRNDTGTHIVAYYQKVTMPDGTRKELKSRTALTAEQWQALAQKLLEAQLAAELNKPKPCTRCGGTGVEP